MIVSNPLDILNKAKIGDFKELITLAKSVDDSVNVEYLVNCYKEGNPNLKVLFNRWQESLKQGKPDYSVYGSNDYLNEVFLCWKEYSREYLNRLRKYLLREDCVIPVNDIHKIIDLGCGLGYTTVALKGIFPNAEVIGTNRAGTLQFNVDKLVTENIDKCTVVDENLTIDGDIDIIFASEFFEHLEDPISFLDEILESYRPKYFIFANTFNQPAIGHFPEYTYKGIVMSGKETTTTFSKTLRAYNYMKVSNTGFFNNRPNLYKYM